MEFGAESVMSTGNQFIQFSYKQIVVVTNPTDTFCNAFTQNLDSKKESMDGRSPSIQFFPSLSVGI